MFSVTFGHFSSAFVILVWPGQYTASPGTDRTYTGRVNNEHRDGRKEQFFYKLFKIVRFEDK